MSVSLARRLRMYALGVVGLRPDDVLLASFPKSGNTWVRLFLQQYLSLAGSGAGPDLDRVDQDMPEFGISDLREPGRAGVLPRFVKTHWRWNPLFRRCRSVLVLRDPRDVMVSYFHFELGRARPRFRGEFADFVRDRRFGLEAWFRHTRSWIGRATVTMRFERMRAQDSRAFAEMLSALEIPHDAGAVDQAARKCGIEELKKMEAASRPRALERRFRPEFKFVRQGAVDGWRSYFSEADLELLRRLGRRYPDVSRHFSWDAERAA